MRGFRWLLLLAITIVLGAVGSSYYLQRARLARESPPPPPELPPNITATSDLWIHTEYDGQRPVVEIRAEKMRQIRQPSEFELTGVELRIFQPGGYDRVRSALATYNIAAHALFSEGDVEITLDVPEGEGASEAELMVIESSGVRFDTEFGKATTDKPTRFRFPRGRGWSVGASYDPGWGDLRMHSEVHLEWFGQSPGDEPIIVEAGELVYKEQHSKVYLSPWSRFRRGELEIEAADSVVELNESAIRRVVAQRARGRSAGATKTVEFAADGMTLEFTPAVALERVTGDGNAEIISTGDGSETVVTSNQMFLAFRPDGGENELADALALGNARMESRSMPGAELPKPARVLASETIKTIMRPGGEEIELIETHEPGTVEFLPATPDQRYRRLEAFRIKMKYGPRNKLEEFQGIDVRTRTEAPGGEEPPALTWSDGMVIEFSDSGAAERLEQWGNFRYEEGPQQAKASRAVFHLPGDLIHLSGGARVWNAEGSTAAAEIILDEKQKRLSAKGGVSSTRLPGDAMEAGNGILGASEPMHATAENMIANSDGSFIAYEGDVVLWQGADRLLAERVEIDRAHGSLQAYGEVKTQFPVRRSSGMDSTGSHPGGFVVVSAAELTYLDEHRLAHYKGGVHLTQTGLQMRSAELRAYFRRPDTEGEAGSGNSLDKAIADGDVRITQSAAGRKREGFAEHAEYYLADERLVLTGGRPQMVDNEGGTTQGSRLTYYARNDSLLVDGADSRPAVSRIRQR